LAVVELAGASLASLASWYRLVVLGATANAGPGRDEKAGHEQKGARCRRLAEKALEPPDIQRRSLPTSSFGLHSTERVEPGNRRE
jgi:hypothetical protein